MLSYQIRSGTGRVEFSKTCNDTIFKMVYLTPFVASLLILLKDELLRETARKH